MMNTSNTNALDISFDRAIMTGKDRASFEIVEKQDIADRRRAGFTVVSSDPDSIAHFETNREKITALLEEISDLNSDMDDVAGDFGSFSGSVGDHLADSDASNREFGALQGRIDRTEVRLKELAPYLFEKESA